MAFIKVTSLYEKCDHPHSVQTAIFTRLLVQQ